MNHDTHPAASLIFKKSLTKYPYLPILTFVLNGEIKRRTEVVGIFPNEEAIVRLVGVLLLEQNDEWAVQRGRYMFLETITLLSDDPIVRLLAVAA